MPLDTNPVAPALLAPVLAQVALTFVLLFWMGRMRYAAVGRREVRVSDIALREPAWPKRITQIANCFHNQLEIPLLFYALVALALATGLAGAVDVFLAWAFAASRLAHAAVFVTSNDVRLRGPLFIVGVVVLMAHWAWFAGRVYLG